jgi:alpha-ribazole phosphatase
MKTRCGWRLLRHAATLGGSGVFVGSSDRPIAPVAQAEAARLVRAIGPVDVALVTPLRRTGQTLALLQEAGLEVSRVQVVPELAEQDFGRWEEQAYARLADDDPDYWPFWDDPVRKQPPGGESFAELFARAAAAASRLRDELDGARVLHVGHAGPIRALLTWMEGGQATDALGRDVPYLSLWRVFGGDQDRQDPASLAGTRVAVVGSPPSCNPRAAVPSRPSLPAKAGSKRT